MTGLMVATKLGEKSKKFNSNTSKIVRYLKNRPGKLISQTELLNNLALTNNSCFNTAYHNGYVLRVKRDEQDLYFYPTEEDMNELKKQFQSTRDEQNPKNYDSEKQNELLEYYANKYLNITPYVSNANPKKPETTVGTSSNDPIAKELKQLEVDNQTFEEFLKSIEKSIELEKHNQSQDWIKQKQEKIEDLKRKIEANKNLLSHWQHSA